MILFDLVPVALTYDCPISLHHPVQFPTWHFSPIDIRYSDVTFHSEEAVSTVAITQRDKIEGAITEALDLLDLEKLFRKKLVAVHPNDTWASREDTTAVTQPDSLRATLRYLKNFGPKELIVTGGSGAGETDEIFRIAGLMDVVKEEKATFFDHNRPPFKEIRLVYEKTKRSSARRAR